MQNEEKYTVCRLCLKSSECTFEYVEPEVVEKLEVLGLELELNISGKPVICRTCLGNLQKFFDFKTICLSTEYFITAFRNERNDVKLDLQQIYLRKNDNKDMILSTRHSVCRLCLEIAEADCYIALNDQAKGTASGKAILERYFLEIDLDITKDPVICTSCNESLYSYFDFAESCLNRENKIRKYCEIEESNGKPAEESKNGLQFSGENISNYKNEYIFVDVLKNCHENELRDEVKLELGNLAQRESQQCRMKHEVIKHEEVDGIKVEKLSDIGMEKYESKQTKCENLVKTESYRFSIKEEEMDIKPEDEDTERFQGSKPISKDVSAVAKRQCKINKFEAKHKSSPKKHLTHHEDISEVVTHQCKKCKYKTQTKCCLNRHMLIHTNDSVLKKHQCDVCTFETRYKNALNRHMLIHKNTSEVTMHSCEKCTYETKYKYALQQHLLTHKGASEVKMYSCGMCTYKTKHVGSLNQHMLIHKNASEVKMYCCEICTYKTKYKGHLKQHMLIHKPTSEVTMYSCGTCSYKTKLKGNLKMHMLNPQKCLRHQHIRAKYVGIKKNKRQS